MEVLGFLFGLAVVSAVGLVFVKHEWWRMIRSTYSRDSGNQTAPRNALIWPSH